MSFAFIGHASATILDGVITPTPDGPAEVLLVAHDGMVTVYGDDGSVTTSPLSAPIVWDTRTMLTIDTEEAHGRAMKWQDHRRYPPGTVPITEGF